MIVTRTVAELSAGIDRRHGTSVALVPTMGALHRGHTSLFDEARRRADVVVASIFVNPLQFGDPADLASYPSTLDTDLALCRRHGVDVVHLPDAATMYPPGFSTSVHVAGITDVLEGRSRPGHFDGVTTVVSKLLNACRPDLAMFGQKDFQQASVVRRMITDLDIQVRLVLVPTERDTDGLALSSRNVRLDPRARQAATALWRGLSAAKQAFDAGERTAEVLSTIVRSQCSSPLIALDYVAVVDAESLEPKQTCDDDTVILIAALVGGVRLIDNVLLGRHHS
ncbi:MAG: pantoate--beta-alanine ligase [Ilumatobacteraceae bacterium]